MSALLRAELRKLRFTRSLWAVPVAGVVFSVVVSGLVIALFKEEDLAARLSEHGPLRFGPANVGLILLVFGIRMFGDEARHHTLPSTYVATPRRVRVLAAKAVVTGAVPLLFCALVFLLVVPITLVGVAARNLPMTVDVADTAALLARSGAAMALMALLGLALAAAVRNRAVVLVAAVVWIALAEDLVGALIKSRELLPAAAVRALVSGSGGADALSTLPAALTLTGLVAVAFGIAATSVRRDVS